MAFGWSKTRYSPIAVDFGVDSVKLLQVILGEPPQIIAAAAMEVPPEARTDPSVRMPFLFEAVSKMVKSQPFKGRRAILSIPSYQTVIQHFQIARLENEDFDSQVALNLRQRLNVDPSRMVIRNFPVTQVTRDGSSKQEVICMAASREAVMKHIEIAHRAKLDVVGMHCEPLAIIKSFRHMVPKADGNPSVNCFLDLGAATTKVVIAHDQQMMFAKTIHIGGDHFTNHVAKAKNISFAEARELRRTQTVTAAAAAQKNEPEYAGAIAEPAAAMPTGASGGMAMIEARMAAERRTQGNPQQVMQANAHQQVQHAAQPGVVYNPAGDTLECMIDELQLCIRHHQSVFPELRIEKLVFLGGESRHVDLCQKIARALHIGAQLGDPLARAVRLTNSKIPTGVDLHQPQPGWAVPMGLCLSDANL